MTDNPYDSGAGWASLVTVCGGSLAWDPGLRFTVGPGKAIRW